MNIVKKIIEFLLFIGINVIDPTMSIAFVASILLTSNLLLVVISKLYGLFCWRQACVRVKLYRPALLMLLLQVLRQLAEALDAGGVGDFLKIVAAVQEYSLYTGPIGSDNVNAVLVANVYCF